MYIWGITTQLRIIASKVSLLSITIALHMFYILLSIAVSLLLLSSTTFRQVCLRGARTPLGMFTLIRLISLMSIPLVNKSCIEGGG